MNKKRSGGASKARYIIPAALLFIFAAAACVYFLFVPVGGRLLSRDLTSVDLSGTAIDDVAPFTRFTGLKSLILEDCGITAADFDTLSSSMPDCDITWSVPLSFGSFSSKSKELNFRSAAQSDFSMLKYFTEVTRIDASGCTCYESLLEYSAAHPECTVLWTVDIRGQSYQNDITEISLPGADSSELDALRFLPALKAADLSGSTEHRKLLELSEAMPGCKFIWTVELAGGVYSSEQSEIDISGVKIGDFESLKASLRYMPSLSKLVMCDCGLSNEQMESLIAEFPHIKFVWRVYFGVWSLRTDATVFSTLNYDPPAYRLVDSEAQVLKYCTDLQMLDLGHNSITSVEPFANLTELRVLILADNRISDISPLKNLKNLRYLEMFINRISDISVLENMPELLDVNFCWNYINDPSVLLKLPKLERVWMCGWQLSGAQKKKLMSDLPDCEFDLYSTYGSTNGTWRLHERFYKIKSAFKNYSGSSSYIWED